MRRGLSRLDQARAILDLLEADGLLLSRPPLRRWLASARWLRSWALTESRPRRGC
jgi:hypothetical protein